MKRILVFAWLLMGLTANAQVSVNWVNYPGGVAIATDASDHVYTANWDYNPGGDITVTKRDTDGNILWSVPYDNTNTTRHEVATWVDTDNQGNVLVSGTIRSGYSNPVNANSVLMKFSPSGVLLWRSVYETDFDGSSTNKLLIDSQNNIYVLGRGHSGVGMVTKVKKFSPGGTALWSYFDVAGIGAPINFKFTPDNNIIISARGITGAINGYAKIDLNGNNIWSLAGINSLTAGDAAGDSFGNTYLVNGEYVATNAGSVVSKLSPAGSLIWQHTNAMAGFKIEVGTDNNPIISGFPNSGTAGAAFLKYNSNGNVLWQNLDADGAAYNLLSHGQMKLDASNAAYLAASTLFQMAVCKVNSNGTSAWVATTSGSGAYVLDFGTNNSVFVVGGTTAKLSQSGSTPPPATPSNLVATAAGSSAINLSWTDNASNETGFVLERSLSAGSGFAIVATLPANTTAYNNVGLSASTTYYYRVQASSSGGSSGWSNVASATTTTASAPPAAPSNLVATAAGTSVINLSWTDNASNETGFVLERSLSAGSGFAIVATLPANTTAYNNVGLNASTTYYYRVQASSSGGSSGWSNVASATTTTASAPPAAPSNLMATAASASVINLSWTDNADNETDFVLERSLSMGRGFAAIATLPANTTTYSDSGLSSLTTYYYRVQASNAVGISAWSNVASATTTSSSAPPPAAPSNLVATAAGTSAINLSWTDNAANETGFVLERSLSAGSGFTSVATLPANTTAYSDSGLSSSTTYYYRVQASNVAGNSAWSNVASATTTSSATPPAAPSNLVATAAGASAINLSWTDNAANETGFVLERSLSAGSGFTTVATLPANTTTYSDSGLSSSTTYYYRVRASNVAGNSAWSNVASATTAAVVATPPNAPSDLVATATGCNAIQLNWSDNATNETGFVLERSLSPRRGFVAIAMLPANTTFYTNTGLNPSATYYYRLQASNTVGSSEWSNIAEATASCPSGSLVVHDILLYPNPASNGVFYLELPVSGTTFPATLQLFSMTGQEVLRKDLYDYRNAINDDGLANGTYLLTVRRNGEIYKLKIVINR